MVLQGAPDVTNECLDILNEVITKHGSLMTQQHAQLTGALLPLLDDRRSPMRKRAIGCLGKSGLFLQPVSQVLWCSASVSTARMHAWPGALRKKCLQKLGCVAVAQLADLEFYMQQTASALHHAGMVDLHLQVVLPSS